MAADDRTPLLLFADDDRSTRELVATIFEREGFRVLLSEDAEGLIDCVNLQCEAGDCPDVILSDVNFFNASGATRGSKLSGIGAAFAIHGKFKNLPILFLSGMTDSLTRKNAREAADADVIAKPFDPRNLVARVRDALRFRVPEHAGDERRRYGINNSGHARRRSDRRVEMPAAVASLIAHYKASGR